MCTWYNFPKACQEKPQVFQIEDCSSFEALGALLAALLLLPPLCRWPLHSGTQATSGNPWICHNSELCCSAAGVSLNFWANYMELRAWNHFLGLSGGFAHGCGSLLSLQAGFSFSKYMRLKIGFRISSSTGVSELMCSALRPCPWQCRGDVHHALPAAGSLTVDSGQPHVAPQFFVLLCVRGGPRV